MMDSTPDYTKWFALAGEGTAPASPAVWLQMTTVSRRAEMALCVGEGYQNTPVRLLLLSLSEGYGADAARTCAPFRWLDLGLALGGCASL